MEEIAKSIFKSAVDAVTPHELITKRQIIALKRELDREFLEIKNNDSVYKLDVTDKNIHIGECHSRVAVIKLCLCYNRLKFIFKNPQGS
jgi:hypothetical protein